MRALILLAMLADAAHADPEIVGSARLGFSHYILHRPEADTDALPGNSPTLAAEVGLAFARLGLEPSFAIEVAQFSGPDFELGYSNLHTRERVISATARLRMSITDAFAITGGLGGAVTFERELGTDHLYGYRFELGASIRLWHDAGQAVRLDLGVANMTFALPGPGDLNNSIEQLGGSIGYTLSF